MDPCPKTNPQDKDFSYNQSDLKTIKSGLHFLSNQIERTSTSGTRTGDSFVNHGDRQVRPEKKLPGNTQPDDSSSDYNDIKSVLRCRDGVRTRPGRWRGSRGCGFPNWQRKWLHRDPGAEPPRLAGKATGLISRERNGVVVKVRVSVKRWRR